MKKILKFILAILSNVSYLLIGIYVFFSIPVLFGYKPLIVVSGSMEPNYKIGSILYYKKVSMNDIKENDVITFGTKNDSNVTHRVFELTDEGFITKGDANLSPDSEIVTFDMVKGKVLDFSVSYIGFYINFVNNHLHLVWIIVVILVSEFFIENMESFKIKIKKKGVELK